MEILIVKFPWSLLFLSYSFVALIFYFQNSTLRRRWPNPTRNRESSRYYCLQLFSRRKKLHESRDAIDMGSKTFLKIYEYLNTYDMKERWDSCPQLHCSTSRYRLFHLCQPAFWKEILRNHATNLRIFQPTLRDCASDPFFPDQNGRIFARQGTDGEWRTSWICKKIGVEQKWREKIGWREWKPQYSTKKKLFHRKRWAVTLRNVPCSKFLVL